MEITSKLKITLISLMCILSITNGEPESFVTRIKESGILSIGENYTSLKKLTYGQKCSIELEEQAIKVGDSVMPIVSKLLPIAVALQTGNQFEITESLIVEIEQSLIPVKEFTQNISNSEAGGLCNTTKYLFCDKTVEECRCGKSVKPKGYSYTIDNGTEQCRFELGSGCLPPELEMLALQCRPGTQCVTPIANVPCSTENMIIENLTNPVLSRNIAMQKGYVCFCDENSTSVDVDTTKISLLNLNDA